MYEPYIQALATHFEFTLPPWTAEESWKDNWQSSFWEQHDKGRKKAGKRRADHF